jgi:hypothetical protein
VTVARSRVFDTPVGRSGPEGFPQHGRDDIVALVPIDQHELTGLENLDGHKLSEAFAQVLVLRMVRLHLAIDDGHARQFRSNQSAPKRERKDSCVQDRSGNRVPSPVCRCNAQTPGWGDTRRSLCNDARHFSLPLWLKTVFDTD